MQLFHGRQTEEMDLQLYIVFSCLLIDFACGSFSAIYTNFNGSYYTFHQRPRTFPNALRNCRSINGIIAPVRTPAEGAFLRSFSNQFVMGRIWIGGTDINRRDGDYIWLDNSPLIYKNWSPGEPLNAGGKENCMVMERGKSALWNDIDCNLFRHPYFCVVRRDPLQWTVLHPAYEYRYFNTSRNYVEAEKVCVSYGGTLVSLNHTYIHLSILNSLRAVFLRVSASVKNVSPVWLKKGHPILCSIYNGENTVTRDHCNSEHPFICMRSSVPSTSTTQITTSVPTTTTTTAPAPRNITTTISDSKMNRKIFPFQDHLVFKQS